MIGESLELQSVQELVPGSASFVMQRMTDENKFRVSSQEEIRNQKSNDMCLTLL